MLAGLAGLLGQPGAGDHARVQGQPAADGRRAQPEGGPRARAGRGKSQVEQRITVHGDRIGLQRRSVLAGQGGGTEAELTAYVRARQAHRTEVTGARGPEVGPAVIAAERVADDRYLVGQKGRPSRRR